jgi:hypothetical protein
MNVSMAATLTTSPKNKTAPKTPVWNFAGIDNVVNGAARQDATVQLTLTGPMPAWATGDHKVSSYKIDPAKFALFASAVAQHFDGRVDAISVMNEPNWPTSMMPIKGKCTTKTSNGRKKKTCADLRPQSYRNIYKAAYAAIKKASPQMPVWIGELSPQGRATTKGAALAPLSFLRSVLCLNATATKLSCGGLKADGLALHPYLLGQKPTAKPKGADDLSMAVLSRASSLLTKAEKLKALRTSLGKTGIPIYLTEFGYLTIKGERGVTTAQQAVYIPQAIKMAQKASRVRDLVLYELIDPYAKNATWIGGLYTRGGTAKPVVKKLEALNF